VSKSTSWNPSLAVDGDGSGVMSRAVALLRTVAETGLERGLSAALAPWRKPAATHDLGKVVLDLAVAVAIGADCAADISVLRCEPGVLGVWPRIPLRLIATLAADAPEALAAIADARSTGSSVGTGR
jgi:hypothetical protein